MTPSDVRIAPQVATYLSRLPEEDRGAVAGLIARIELTPITTAIGVPTAIAGEGFIVLYEIDERYVANVTTCRRTPRGYPQNM